MFDFLINFWDNLLQHMGGLIFLLVAGFVLLVKGADWLVDGASGLAKRWGVSDLVIGLTVVAFGTSMPEFVVNIISASQGSTELAITNVLGSNAINIFVILGLTAVIWPVTSKPQSQKIDIPVSCVATLIVLFFACYSLPEEWTWKIWEHFHRATSADQITRLNGVVLVACFLGYMYFLFRHARENADENGSFVPMKVWKALLFILVGLACLTAGGQFIVVSATKIAQKFELSEAVIGLTIVALGTSLPELATSCVAAFKKNCDLALGNCVGSCIFNVFFVLGITALIHPLSAYEGMFYDALLAAAGPLLVCLFVVFDKQKRITRLEGASLLVVYAVYLFLRLKFVS